MSYENISEIVDYLEALRLDSSPKTIETYIYSIDKFVSYFKIESFDEIKSLTASDIRKFQSFLKDSGLAMSSINTVMRPLKAMYNWFINDKKLSDNPLLGVKALKEPKKEQAFFTEQEMKALIISAPKLENKLIFALLFTTGLRRDELVKLRVENFNGTHIKVEGKGQKERSLILQRDVIVMLYFYLEWRNQKYGYDLPNIFLSKYKTPFKGESILYKVKAGIKRAGFPENRIKALHTHSLRHTFCTNILEVSDPYTAQKAMGHANLSTTTKYMHLRDSALDRAMLNQQPIF
jgi:integrase/recombinase XerC